MKFPEGWKPTALGKVLERVVLPVNVEPSREYRQIGIRSHGKGIFHKRPVTGESLGEKRVFWVVPDALTLNIVFAWEQAVAVTSDKEVGMIASHRFPMYCTVPDVCDVHFLKHFFMTPRGKDLLEIASPGGAGRNKTLGQSAFERLKVPLPSISHQQRTSTILEIWDMGIAKAKALTKIERDLHKRLLGDLTTGEKRVCVKVSKWSEVALGKIGDTFGGLGGKSKEDFGQGSPYIPYRNIFRNSRINIKDFDYVQVGEFEKQSLCRKGDIFFTSSSETVEELGMASVLLDDVEALYLNSFSIGYRLQARSGLLPEYARFALRGPQIRRTLDQVAQGYTRFNLSKKELLKLRIRLPPTDEQRVIAEVLNASEKRVIVLTKRQELLEKERAALLEKLVVRPAIETV